MKPTILVNLKRCTGCWTCTMSCKVAHDLEPDEWRMTVRTLGSGAGIDEPAGQYPDCTMSWMPIYSKKCTMCAERMVDGKPPHCEYNCPTHAITYGDIEDEQSPVSVKLAELRAKGYRVWQQPAFEGSRDNVMYADV